MGLSASAKGNAKRMILFIFLVFLKQSYAFYSSVPNFLKEISILNTIFLLPHTFVLFISSSPLSGKAFGGGEVGHGYTLYIYTRA